MPSDESGEKNNGRDVRRIWKVRSDRRPDGRLAGKCKKNEKTARRASRVEGGRKKGGGMCRGPAE